MKADRDDAPVRVAAGVKKTAVWLVALLIGTSITGGGLYLASAKTSVKESVQHTLANFGYEKPAEVANSGMPKKEIRDEAYWDRIVAEQAKRDAYEQLKNRHDGQGQDMQAYQQRKAEQERRANEAIRTVNARNFGEGVVEQPAQKTGAHKPNKVVIVGKRETKISDYCPGGEGSITRRNCRAMIELQSRN